MGAATNEYEKLTASPHFSTLQKVAASAELSIPKLAFDSDQDGGTPQREAPADRSDGYYHTLAWGARGKGVSEGVRGKQH